MIMYITKSNLYFSRIFRTMNHSPRILRKNISTFTLVQKALQEIEPMSKPIESARKKVLFSEKKFDELNLPVNVVNSLHRFGFHNMTKTQEAAWNSITENKDTLILAPTGSGKTLSYILPVVANIQPFNRIKRKSEKLSETRNSDRESNEKMSVSTSNSKITLKTDLIKKAISNIKNSLDNTNNENLLYIKKNLTKKNPNEFGSTESLDNLIDSKEKSNSGYLNEKDRPIIILVSTPASAFNVGEVLVASDLDLKYKVQNLDTKYVKSWKSNVSLGPSTSYTVRKPAELIQQSLNFIEDEKIQYGEVNIVISTIATFLRDLESVPYQEFSEQRASFNMYKIYSYLRINVSAEWARSMLSQRSRSVVTMKPRINDKVGMAINSEIPVNNNRKSNQSHSTWPLVQNISSLKSMDHAAKIQTIICLSSLTDKMLISMSKQFSNMHVSRGIDSFTLPLQFISIPYDYKLKWNEKSLMPNNIVIPPSLQTRLSDERISDLVNENESSSSRSNLLKGEELINSISEKDETSHIKFNNTTERIRKYSVKVEMISHISQNSDDIMLLFDSTPILHAIAAIMTKVKTAIVLVPSQVALSALATRLLKEKLPARLVDTTRFPIESEKSIKEFLSGEVSVLIAQQRTPLSLNFDAAIIVQLPSQNENIEVLLGYAKKLVVLMDTDSKISSFLNNKNLWDIVLDKTRKNGALGVKKVNSVSSRKTIMSNTKYLPSPTFNESNNKIVQKAYGYY